MSNISYKFSRIESITFTLSKHDVFDLLVKTGQIKHPLKYRVGDSDDMNVWPIMLTIKCEEEADAESEDPV